MNRWKAPLKYIVYPPLHWGLLLSLFCIPALGYVFVRNQEDSIAAYFIFAVSAYALFLWAVRIPRLVKQVKEAVYRHHLGRRYLTDFAFRGRLSLQISTGINFCYALFKLGAGIYYRSFWFGAIAVYYLILTVMRALLLRGICRGKPDRRHELQAARLCGCLLFALNVALSAVTVQMVIAQKGYEYPGYLIFVMAFYAFYSTITSIINLIRFRRLNSPVLSASKVLGVATAFVSMLSLQTAMFASFGGEYHYQRLMNSLTGGAICFLIFLAAVLMICRTTREIKRMEPASS